MPINEIATATRRPAQQPRLAHLDGLRGLAIIAVLLYHAYARWPQVMPFGAAFAVPPLDSGWAGVQLFFLISGFVIFMTLERSRTLADFAFNRWSRLFPAMLACSIMILVLSPLLPERPHPTGSLVNLLPGLTFIAPNWWSLVNLDVTPIEGAFWSLFVEVQFYAIAGLSYFAFGKRGALLVLAACFALAQTTAWPILPPDGQAHRLIFALTDRIGAIHYGWFLSGALLYQHHRTHDARLLACAFAVLALSCGLTTSPGDWLTRSAALACVSLVFVAALMAAPVQRFFSHRIWLFLGVVSYPLYLNHENMVAALTRRLGQSLPDLPHALLPLLPMAAAIALAWLVATWVEPALRQALRRLRAHLFRSSARYNLTSDVAVRSDHRS